MKISKSLIICILIVSASGCKTRTDCTELYSDIKERFDSGYFREASMLADSLRNNCQDKSLILKSDSLMDISERIRLDFSISEEQFLSKASGSFGNITDSMKAEWDRNKWIEWRMIDGEKKYFNRADANLVLLKMFYKKKEKQILETATDPEMILRLQHTGEIIKQSGDKTDPVVPVDMKITYTITVQPDAAPDGEKIRCWMPLPKENHSRQQNLELLTTSSAEYIIAPDSAVHRSLYMEETSAKGTPTVFSISYRYRSSAQYFNPEALKPFSYNKTSALYKKYTSEQLPHICFTEDVRNLADEITAPDDDPPAIVRKIYLWFKENIPWTGALEYSTMPNIPEYVYDNRRGDCGMQTFLFMSMLRYKGIPVRWQSGWKVPPGYKNLHDWCEVYYEGTGWVPVDISYDLQYSDNNRLEEFFISGIDSYRLIVNDGVAGALYPEKKYLRSEPYDFQRGEVEWKGGNLYFDKWSYNMKIEYLKGPIQYVDPLIGTAPANTESARRHSIAGSEEKGQTFPGVGRPFGMTQWTPETRTTEFKCISPYYYNDKFITGFRGSHWMSGSCTQDYGSVTLMPFTSTRPDTVKRCPVSSFSHSSETSTPAYYSVMLNDFGIEAEMTASVRTGMLRFTFPGDKTGCIFLRSNSDENQGSIRYDPQKKLITGYNPVHRIYQGRGQYAGFNGWFTILFDKPFTVMNNGLSKQNMVLSFGNERNVQAIVGTSFTGPEAAAENMSGECHDTDFDKLRKETEDIWNSTLDKITVKRGSNDDLVKFYTALYHCYQLPRIASDLDGSYQGFAGDTTIHKAEGFSYYDDFSMWDTYRALHPLMTILEPGATLDMIKSLVLKAEQGGWMPIFPAWASYTAAMIGDHVSTMISDACIKGIDNFDIENAYKYMRKNAFETPARDEYIDGKGRRALTSYLKYGYIPLEDSVWDAFHRREQVSRTLEYALDDYALAQVAKRTGKTDDYKALIKRSENYKNVFNVSTGYVRGRHADGSWYEPFDPNEKASFITEGTPFQYTWYVPQDVPGLMKLMGGKKAYLKKLNEFFDGGFYWHGNETDQQAPFMFATAGDPGKTQYWTHRINSEEYGTGPGGLSGNEDAGQMSAWLVFSMLGFYPVCPASGEYIITAPAFDEIRIMLPDGKYFISRSSGLDEKSFYIKSMLKDGKRYKGSIITHKEIMNGCLFELQMTAKPD